MAVKEYVITVNDTTVQELYKRLPLKAFPAELVRCARCFNADAYKDGLFVNCRLHDTIMPINGYCNYGGTEAER